MHVDRLLVEGGRVAGVVLDSGEVVPADAVIVNGDVAAVASGLFGPKVARVVPRRPVGQAILLGDHLLDARRI